MEKNCEFEKSVALGLCKCGVMFDKSCVPNLVLGVAVSGGADSVAMLTALCAVCKDKGVPLRVVTVNHNIRDEAESAGDAEFVHDLCRRFAGEGVNISCDIKTLPRGEIKKTAESRKGGVEEAARFCRYKIFSGFAKERGVTWLCTAHTKDDNAETLLMRFLQGSSLPSPIKRARGLYVRPMLDLTRVDIEKYLAEKKIAWRTDSTNASPVYLRNKIRTVLVPLLDKEMPAWKNSVVSAGARCAVAEDFILAEAQKLPRLVKKSARSGCDKKELTEHADEICFAQKDFCSAARIVRIRSVFAAMNELGIGGRIPYDFAEKIADCFSGKSCCPKIDKTGKSYQIASFSGVSAFVCGGEIFLKKTEKVATEKVFFATIEGEGEYFFPFGKICVSRCRSDGCINLSVFARTKAEGQEIKIARLAFPFCVRSKMAGDWILCADGKAKSVADIFSSWKIPVSWRDEIPVLHDLQGNLLAVLGCVFGFENWVLK